MRRIPRPLRAIEPSHPLTLPRRPQLWCTACPRAVAAAAAPFSTSPARGFLVPAGKQDKKKHQQFVRRWQKRLLGDSEPIGAHVDPYDPTSPVRIAPEEQGEYEEVLDEDAVVEVRKSRTMPDYRHEEHSYQPAHSTRRLPRVGDEEWLRARRDVDMAREYEKLTGRTYTPLSLEMATAIEGLTGTPYTLRNENLLLAQTVHNATGRPYTHYNYGLHRKPATPRELRQRFERAVTEVFALKLAGLDMDVSKLPNCGVYEAPRWVQDIKLYEDSGKLALAYPQHKSAAEFLSLLNTVPELETSDPKSDDPLIDLAEVDAVVDVNAAAEATSRSEPTVSAEQLPTMDPATPAFKRAAVIKVDAENKFDFMSNRPVPRAKPVEQAQPVAEAKVEPPVVAEVIVEEVTPSLEAKAEQPAVSEVTVEEITIAPLVPEQASPESIPSTPTPVESTITPTASTTQEITASEEAAHSSAVTSTPVESGPEPPTVEEIKWRSVRINGTALKFNLCKRIHQLTSLRLSDPHLTATRTLGDLYGHLCDAMKPKPATLYSTLFVEGQKARERTKRQQPTEAKSRQKANLGDLINLGNVEIRRARPTKTEQKTKIGIDKVVQYALWERGLRAPGYQSGTRKATKSAQRPKKVSYGPDMGRIISRAGAEHLERASPWSKN